MSFYIDWLSRQLARVTGVVLVALAIGIVGSLLLSIFFRYVVGQALSWPEEISLILFTWLVMLAGSVGVREGFHVQLTFFTNLLPIRLYVILKILTHMAIIGFGVAMAYSGFDLVERTARNLTPTLRIRLDYLHYSVPVCGILIVLHSLSNLLKREERNQRIE